jgi:RimJ/RimL family protein N-acetyltransferase
MAIRLEPLTDEDIRSILADRPADAAWAPDYPTEGDVRVATRLRDGSTDFPATPPPWDRCRVVDVDSGLTIGGIGFHRVPDDDGVVEIGYGIATSFQGRGAATQAVSALIDVAVRGGARVVVAGTDADNLASQRVLEKNGFRRTADDGSELRWALRLPHSTP